MMRLVFHLISLANPKRNLKDMWLEIGGAKKYKFWNARTC